MAPTDSDDLISYRLDASEKRQDAIDAHLRATDAEIAKINDERTKALKWGITSLGSFVIFLIGLVTKYLWEHLK